MSVSGTTNGIRPGVCLSTNKPESPFIGQVIYMSDTDETAVWEGTYWEGLNRSRDRNVVINGAMQVHQRGTSNANNTTGGYRTADRFGTAMSSLGTWTESVENDAPTGSGFRKSLKMTCTTADASPAAGDYLIVQQGLEGQNVQQFLKGTSSAKQFTLSFWVKGTTTGTYIAELFDDDNSRAVSASYSIVTANTWEKKTITFPADTTGVLDNDNAKSLTVNFWLGAGSNLTTGSLRTTWSGYTDNGRATGVTNLAGATNRSWQITGVQLEAGSVATPFEFENYGTTLAKCQRYYQQPKINVNAYSAQYAGNGVFYGQVVSLPVEMRAAPTMSRFSRDSGSWYWVNAGTAAYSADSEAGVSFYTTVNSYAINQARQSGNATPTSGAFYILEAAATFAAASEL